MKTGRKKPFRSVAILGIGLLGGSLAMAVHRFLPGCEVRLWARRAQTLAQVAERKLASFADADICRVVKGAELVILCTPISTFEQLVEKFLPSLDRNSIITDVGSVKQSVHTSIGNLLTIKRYSFIGSHPMAGAEKQGFAHARADLFQGAAVALVNPHRVKDSKLLRLAEFWEALGGHPILLQPSEHDAAVARVSHLPHVLAALCARNAMGGEAAPSALAALASSGFRDTTRICHGNAEMWTDILLANQKPVLEAIGDCENDLATLRQLLQKEDRKSINAWLERARLNRSDLLPDK